MFGGKKYKLLWIYPVFLVIYFQKLKILFAKIRVELTMPQ